MAMMEEHILEEPHTIFVSVPGTAFNEELLNELPSNRVKEQSLSSHKTTVTREDIIQDESDPLISSVNMEGSSERTQCVIKEEIFIDQDEQCVNKNIPSHTKTDVNEQTCNWEETHHEAHTFALNEPESSSSLLRFLLSTQRGQSNDKKKKEYVCEVCNKVFKWSSSFYRHKLRNHYMKDSQYSMCNDSSEPVVNAVVGHRSDSVPEGRSPVKARYVCNVCKKEFRWSSSYRRHKVMHYRQLYYKHDITDHSKTKKTYVCDVCNKVISSQRAFRRHTTMHDRQMNNQNDIYNDNNKLFDSSEIGDLPQEISTVSEDRPMVCAFIQSGSLSKHKLVHSDFESV